MPIEPISQGTLAGAAAFIVGAGLWMWRGVSLGIRVGKLIEAVERQGEDIKYIRDKLDGHIEKEGS